jgi:hypothetical protein
VRAQAGHRRTGTADLEQSLLVLVVGLAGIGATALGRLAVTEIQHELLLGGTASS